VTDYFELGDNFTAIAYYANSDEIIVTFYCRRLTADVVRVKCI